MSYLLAISGHPSKFSRPGFLLQAFARHLDSCQLELKIAYAIDLKMGATDAPAYLTRLYGLIRNARGILLLAPIPKEDWSGCLGSLLDGLPNAVFQHKPVLLVGSGGFVGEMQELEHSLAPKLDRLAAHVLPDAVHVGVRNWVFVGDQAPSLTVGTEARLATALHRICADNPEHAHLPEAA